MGPIQRPLVTLSALTCWVALFAALGTVASADGRGTALKVDVRGLPGGAKGTVVVLGPHHFKQVVSHTTTIHRIPTGRYRIRTLPTTLTRRARGIPAGSVAYPTRRIVKVTVTRAEHEKTRVRYGTIRSSRVIVLDRLPQRVIGPKNNPKAVVLPASIAQQVRRGSILTSAPRRSLPSGLFDRVTRLSGGPHPRAHLQAASLWDAFPTLDLNATTPLETGFGGGGDARASGLEDVDLALAKELTKQLGVSCGAPPTGWSLAPSGSLHSWVTSDLHRRFLALPYGKLTLTVQGKISLSSTIPTGAHCDLSLSGPKLQAAVIVFGVPVPIGAKVDFKLSLQNDSPIKTSFNASVTATGGIELAGKDSKPILSVKNQATGSVDADAGSVSFGPEVQAILGAVTGLNAHLSVEPRITAKASRTSCEIDIGVNAGAGLDLGPLHPSFTPFTPSAPVYKCPLRDGVFFDGGPGSGPPPSTLGPYTMTPFGKDSQDTGLVDGVSGPTGGLVFPDPLDHQLVGQGWATWSHGYQGDVYMSDELVHTATVDLPAGTHAFYLYAEPNVFADFNVSATTSDGVSSGPVTVYGDSGATFFGFYATGSRTLSRITVNADDMVAIGEFGIAR